VGWGHCSLRPQHPSPGPVTDSLEAFDHEVSLHSFEGISRELGTQAADSRGMSDGEKLLKLIEEMVELKVQLHAGIPAGTKPGLVQLVAKKRHEDTSRLAAVREQIVQMFNG
jgi:hypothetical protein